MIHYMTTGKEIKKNVIKRGVKGYGTITDKT